MRQGEAGGVREASRVREAGRVSETRGGTYRVRQGGKEESPTSQRSR